MIRRRAALGISVMFTLGAAPTPSPSPAAASDPCGSIASLVDRPTVATSPCTVRPHESLLENGWTSTVTAGPGGGTTTSYPQSFWRVGTSDPHLEYAFGLPSFNRASAGGAPVSGWSDFSFGAKYEMGYNAKAVWGVGAVVSIPTGARPFTAGNAEASGDFNWTYALDPVWSLAGTVSANELSAPVAGGTAQSYFAWIPSVVLSATLPHSSSVFVEYALYSRAAPGAGGRSLIDAGYIRDIGANVQLDAEYGDSPTHVLGQTQRYVGAGASVLF